MDWKLISEIPGYEAFTNYELNIAGDLRNRKTGRLRKWRINNSGYFQVEFTKTRLRKHILKHIAICRLFKPNPENKPFVDHWNRNSLDNSFDNLRWVTSEENMHNKSTRSDNTTGEQNIYSTIQHGYPIWRIEIKSYGKKFTKQFRRDLTDVIPQEVIQWRDWMKLYYHPTAPTPTGSANCSTQGSQDPDMPACPAA